MSDEQSKHHESEPKLYGITHFLESRIAELEEALELANGNLELAKHNRDYLRDQRRFEAACHAMQGLMAKYGLDEGIANITVHSCAMAVALIAELDKESGGDDAKVP